jgi:hypothetical protein
VRQADALRDVVICSHAEPRHSVEIAVPRREKDDGQRLGAGAQFAAQRKTAIRLVAEADVEDSQVGQARL